MFDIVVCSKNKDLVDRSIKVINRALISYEFNYHIDKYNDSKLDYNGRKIYLIDVDDYLNIAHKIRKHDFMSIIILISSSGKIIVDIFHEKLLILDYICLDRNYNNNLRKSINMSLKILFSDNIFSFMYNHVIYCIPYKDITYIEKEINVKRCIIHTLNNDYYIIDSIMRISNSLCGMFIKSSQSCIINLSNIDNIDCVNNLVYFKNGSVTSLISNKSKKTIREYINISVK